MFRLALFAALFTFAISLTPLRADEIKLKSGEVIKNCKVKSKRKGKWTLVLLDGSRKVINASDVVSHVEKPTIADELDLRIKKAGKKDKAALLDIGREAMAAGAKRQGVKALKRVTRLDKNNKEAHRLLGDVKCEDGKWRGGRSLEKYREKQRINQLKAKGWTKVKGKWVDPLTAGNLKAGLVKIKGKWFTKKHAANLKAGQIYVHGTWYAPGDKTKLDQGMLKYKGKWLKISTINSRRKKDDEPWSLVGDHFIVNGKQSYKTLLTALSYLEDTWKPMSDFFGQEPSATKLEDKIVVNIAKDATEYNNNFQATGGDDRCAYFSSTFGAAYCSKTGMIETYYYNIDFLMQFIQQAAACAFQAKLLGYDNCPSNFYDAFACYIEGFKDGKYTCYGAMVRTGLQKWAEPGDPFEQIIQYDLSRAYPTGEQNERRFARLGFLIYYLKKKHPDVIDAWVSMVFAKKGETKSLVEKAKAMLKNVNVEKEFSTFLKKFVANYKEPTIHLKS